MQCNLILDFVGRSNKNIIGVNWVCCNTKYNVDGFVDKYKASLTEQYVKKKVSEKGEDFKESFSLTTRLKTMQSILIMYPTKEMFNILDDVNCAFLNGCHGEEVFTKQPPRSELLNK